MARDRCPKVAASINEQLAELESLSYRFDTTPVDGVVLTSAVAPHWSLERLRRVADCGGVGIAAGDIPSPTLAYVFTYAALALTLRIELPRGYPVARKPPVLLLDSPGFLDDRSHFVLLSLLDGVGARSDGLCVRALVECCGENAPAFVRAASTGGASSGAASASDSFLRAFIKFHHMLIGKEHKKEAKVVSAAKQQRLSGFIVYGKPSVICVECAGGADDLAAFLRAASGAGKAGDVTLLHCAADASSSDVAALATRFDGCDVARYDARSRPELGAKLANNGKAGLQVVKPLGKKGETADLAALQRLLGDVGLSGEAAAAMGRGG